MLTFIHCCHHLKGDCTTITWLGKTRQEAEKIEKLAERYPDYRIDLWQHRDGMYRHEPDPVIEYDNLGESTDWPGDAPQIMERYNNWA